MTPRRLRQTGSSTRYARERTMLRAVGLRCTQTRCVVLHELLEDSAPVSHPEIAARVAAHALDWRSIFRSLHDFTRAGLLIRLNLGDHVWRFEVTGPWSQKPDHRTHFLCEECSSVVCLDDAQVRISPGDGAPRALSSGVIPEVLIKGRCDRCS